MDKNKQDILNKHEKLVNEYKELCNCKDMKTLQEWEEIHERKELIKMEIDQYKAIEKTWEIPDANNMNLDLKMLTQEDVANLLHTTVETVAMYRETGLLQSIYIGKCYMFSPSEIYQFQQKYKGMDIRDKKKCLLVYQQVNNAY
ncbi:MAG: helix-turn-helix domain-containing protein [Erysipelotrichaceae bacterium]|nr:helix-turn-helix domain-containing protein [Erysipelotrichaceae bacterium]